MCRIQARNAVVGLDTGAGRKVPKDKGKNKDERKGR